MYYKISTDDVEQLQSQNLIEESLKVSNDGNYCIVHWENLESEPESYLIKFESKYEVQDYVGLPENRENWESPTYD